MNNIESISSENNYIYTTFLSISLLLIPLSFSLQVIYMQPFMALLPYFFLLIALLFILPIYNLNGMNHIFINIPSYIYLFGIFVIFSQSFQLMLGLISINELVSSVLFLLLPMLFYLPFRFFVNRSNVNIFLFCIAIAGVIVSIFFIYDTVSKFIFREITPYAKQAFDYSIAQQGVVNLEDVNRARISTLSRSHGLLQSHSVSSLWVMVSYFALMAIYDFKKVSLMFVTSIFFITLLVAMNFSSIIIFFLLSVFIYFEYFKILFLRITSNNIIFIFFALIGAALLTGLILFNLENPLVKYFYNVATLQFSALFGTGGVAIENLSTGNGVSFSDMYAENITNYKQVLLQYPYAIITGTGFSSTMMGYGGDTGIIETVSKFSPGIFLIVLFAYLKVIYKSIIGVHIYKGSFESYQYKFIASILLAVLIYEYHYSIWGLKNVLPLIFIALGMYDSLNSKNSNLKYKQRLMS
tara:strand:+ start:3043 stop:4446 length:1404 start_codon:yes stop_codon:yes gene_type:complete